VDINIVDGRVVSSDVARLRYEMTTHHAKLWLCVNEDTVHGKVMFSHRVFLWVGTNLSVERRGVQVQGGPLDTRTNATYIGTSVHELNPFLEAVREPKCS
jgi:hypothetical protein